jgi:hypothetical protein
MVLTGGNDVWDIFVVKLNSRGDVLWKKTFGGRYGDVGQSIITTPDGGCVLTGRTASVDGDFEGMNKGELDIFVIKLNRRGDVLWKKTFGARYDDKGYSISTTPDGGTVLTGVTKYSTDGDFEGMSKGYDDIFVIKLNDRGDVLWKKTFGGTGNDQGQSIATTPDGDVVLTGRTYYSNYGDFKEMNKGRDDIFVIKLNDRGDVLWKQTLGGSLDEVGESIVATSDGGCVLTGQTRSVDGDFDGRNNDRWGIFVIKLNNRGDVQWKKTFGGSVDDYSFSITAVPDGGYVLTGVAGSVDGDFERVRKGGYDIFVMKLDSNGNLNPSTSIEDHSDISSSFSITPNPLSPLSTISYSLDKPSHIRIEVVNSVGEVVSVLSDKQEDVGSHQIPFSTTHLVTGTYSVRLVENNRVTSKGVVQIR